MTVTVANSVPVLSAESVTLKVTVVVTPRGYIAGPSWVIKRVWSSSTRSVALTSARKSMIAESVSGVPEGSVASTMMLPGAVITGGVESTTVTVAKPVLVLPAESAMLKVTVVVTPRGYIAGPSCSNKRVWSSSTRSVALRPARKAMMAGSDSGVPAGPVASTTMLTGGVTTGAVESTTDTVAVAVPVFSAESVTLKVTVVVTPRGYIAGPSWVIKRVWSSSTRSVALTSARKSMIAESVSGVPEGSVASTMMLPGAVITGGVESTTVTVAKPVLVLPAESAMLKVTVVVTPRGYIAGPSCSNKRVWSSSTRSVALRPARKAMMAGSDSGVPAGPVASTTMLTGGVTTGAVESTTDTVAVAVPVFSAESVTLKVTVVVTPRGYIAGPSWVIKRVWSSSTRSVALTSARKAMMAGSVAGVPADSVASTVMSRGAVTTGAVPSMSAESAKIRFPTSTPRHSGSA